MLKRLIKWNAERREWAREHERAWAGLADPTESGLSPFQLMCEAAVVTALRTFDMPLLDRRVEGAGECYVTAKLAGTDWTLWIYLDGAEVSSKSSTLVRMEEWDAKTPQEFIATFVSRTIAGVRKSREGSV
jgi:hypothetical protein